MSGDSPIDPQNSTPSASPPSSRRGFPTTRWSVVLDLIKDETSEVGIKALDTLCRDYWHPLCQYLIDWGLCVADAQDVTQGFLLQFISRDGFRRASSDKGRLRTYLLTSLKRYAAQQFQQQTAQKRGGDFVLISIDQDPDGQQISVRCPVPPPDRAFELNWARTVIARSVSHLEVEYSSRGQAEIFALLRDHLGANEGEESHAELASQLNIARPQVALKLFRMRHRLGRIIRKELVRGLDDSIDVEDEFRYLQSLFSAA